MLKVMLYWVMMAQQQCPGGGECVPVHPHFTVTIHVTSTHVWPSGTSQGGPITVTGILSPAQAGQTISFASAAAGNAGGHSGHSGTRPVGNFSAQTAVTGANGQASVQWTPPAFGGDVNLTASIPTSGAASATIDISVPGLSTLAGGGGFQIVGSTSSHPVNHYVNATAAGGLPGIASAYEAQFYPNGGMPGTDLLRYNDMSLERGGKFDLNANWCISCSHFEHQEGANCDVGSGNVPANRHAALSQMFTNNGATALNEGNHWHLRF
jgi:hypothetical protein